MTPRNRRSKLQDIQQIADSLRADAPIEGGESDLPDFTHAIIQRVHAQRPFLTRRTRRLVVACRYGAAIAAVLTVGGIVLVQATAPRITELASPLQPVTFSPAVDSVRDTTTQAVNNVRRCIREINTLTDPARNNVVLASCLEPSAPGAAGDCSPLSVSVIASSPQARGPYVPVSYAGSVVAANADETSYFSVNPGIASASGKSRISSLRARSLMMYSPEPYSLRPVSVPACSLLDDFPMFITGQPAGDGFVPQ